MSSDAESGEVAKQNVNMDEKTDVNKADRFDDAHRIATKEQVPGHENYYERDGLRTYGDGEDHDHEPPVCLRTI